MYLTGPNLVSEINTVRAFYLTDYSSSVSLDIIQPHTCGGGRGKAQTPILQVRNLIQK